jgi:hypothetical protein
MTKSLTKESLGHGKYGMEQKIILSLVAYSSSCCNGCQLTLTQTVMKRSLPQHTYRRLEYSVRTMYSTSVCLLLSYYYPWSKVLLFLSPMISILATVMYLGLWQENTIKVLYSSLIGSSIGTIIGFTYRIKVMQIVLLFVAMVSINRIKCWDRTCYVFCGLALMLGTSMLS